MTPAHVVVGIVAVVIGVDTVGLSTNPRCCTETPIEASSGRRNDLIYNKPVDGARWVAFTHTTLGTERWKQGILRRNRDGVWRIFIWRLETAVGKQVPHNLSERRTHYCGAVHINVRYPFSRAFWNSYAYTGPRHTRFARAVDGFLQVQRRLLNRYLLVLCVLPVVDHLSERGMHTFPLGVGFMCRVECTTLVNHIENLMYQICANQLA